MEFIVEDHSIPYDLNRALSWNDLRSLSIWPLVLNPCNRQMHQSSHPYYWLFQKLWHMWFSNRFCRPVVMRASNGRVCISQLHVYNFHRRRLTNGRIPFNQRTHRNCLTHLLSSNHQLRQQRLKQRIREFVFSFVRYVLP